MTLSRKDVTRAELALLEVLWEGGPATIRELTDSVYPGGSASDYATVKKLLSRLEKKGYIQRDRGAMAHVFSATASREELIGQRLRTLADSLCGGSRTPLLTHLLKTERLSRAELDELQALLAELGQEKKRQRRKRPSEHEHD